MPRRVPALQAMSQNPCGDDGVGIGPMRVAARQARILDAEIRTQSLIRMSRRVRKVLHRESHRAEPLPIVQKRKKAPIEGRVVGHDDGALGQGAQPPGQVVEPRRARYIFVVNPMDRAREGGNETAGIDDRNELVERPAIGIDDETRDLHDPVDRRREARRLDVDHGIALCIHRGSERTQPECHLYGTMPYTDGTMADDRKSLALRRATIAAISLGAFALGAFAMGAVAIGALAIGQLSIGRARIGRLVIGELSVGDEAQPPHAE
jgi:hypothetical protein